MTFDKCTHPDKCYECKKILTCTYYKQQPKTGWHIAHGMYEDRFWCSCGYIRIMDNGMNEWKFCPVCGGARMAEPQESEDKE